MVQYIYTQNEQANKMCVGLMPLRSQCPTFWADQKPLWYQH